MSTSLRTYGAPLLSGLLLALCFPTLHWFFLAWGALIPLLLAASRQRPRMAALQFLLAGWIFHTIVLQWLAANIFWAGGWAIVGYQLLCLYLALYWALLGFVWAEIRRRNHYWGGALCFAALWAVMEWFQATWFSGFGWCALAHSQAPNAPLRQWAAAGGTGSIAFLLVLVNGLAALAIAEPRWRARRGAAAAVVLIVAHLIGVLLPGIAINKCAPFYAGIYQSNYAQTMKWDWEYREDMVRRAAEQSEFLAQNEHVDLFVWPEALVMDEPDKPDLSRWMSALTQGTGVPLFTGCERYDPKNGGMYNSSVLFGPDGTIKDYYDKIHLAPFGEYVPFERYLPFLRQIVPGAGIIPGKEPVMMDAGDRRFGPLICFEVLFGPMSAWYKENGADFLVVITNLGWFGASNAIPQELEIARMRAIETRLPLVHCANTGFSGVIDPLGRFVPLNARMDPYGRYWKYQDEPFEPAMHLMERRFGALLVPCAGGFRVPRGGALFPWLCLGAALVCAGAAYWRKGNPPHYGPIVQPPHDDVMI